MHEIAKDMLLKQTQGKQDSAGSLEEVLSVFGDLEGDGQALELRIDL